LICGYYKAQQDEEHYYLFLEYIRGLNLDEIMVEFGMIPQSIIKYILASVCLFLDHLHSKNIVYRNLNPSNIMIKNSGYLIMTDFSCSKQLEPYGKTNTVAGVPYYMAPEVIRQEEYGLNVDMWSMGVVLYEMMSGSLPFGERAK
jgi:serine/threonine protein kinase